MVGPRDRNGGDGGLQTANEKMKTGDFAGSDPARGAPVPPTRRTARGLPPETPAGDIAAIHRLVTRAGQNPDEQLREYLALGLDLLEMDGGLVGRVAGGRVTVRSVGGALASGDRVRAGDDLSGDVRIAAILERQATVARLDGQGADPADLPIGPGAVVGTPVWSTGRIVGVLAFVAADARAAPFTSWQLGVVELLADGISRLLTAPAVEPRPATEAPTRSLLDVVPDRLYRMDDDGRFVSEPAGRRLTTDSGPDGDAGTDVLLASGVLEAFRTSAINELKRGEVRTRVFPVVDKNRVRRYEARFVRADSNDVLCIVRDVTEQVDTDETLRASEDRYRTLVETLAEGILIHDPTGRVYGCNRSATMILEASERELLRTDSRVPGTTWVLPDGSPLGSQSLPALVTLRTGNPTIDQVLGLERADQPTRWLRVNARPLAVSGDPRLHAVTSFADITAERRAEHALAAQVDFEALAASISTRLIDCPPDLVDDTITGALGEMARLFDADVAFISELTSDRADLRVSHEWRRPGVPLRLPNADAAPGAFAWTARQFEDAPYLLVRSLEDLPPDARAERDAYTSGGNRAFLWVRLGGGARAVRRRRDRVEGPRAVHGRGADLLDGACGGRSVSRSAPASPGRPAGHGSGRCVRAHRPRCSTARDARGCGPAPRGWFGRNDRRGVPAGRRRAHAHAHGCARPGSGKAADARRCGRGLGQSRRPGGTRWRDRRGSRCPPGSAFSGGSFGR